MKTALTLAICGLLAINIIEAPDSPTSRENATNQPDISYAVQKSDDGQLIVKETVIIPASIEDVWHAYTTSEGYAQWAAVAAEIDLRPGGIIRSTYNPNGDLEGDDTNLVHIINFVPERLLTMQAEVSENWPEVLKRDAANLYNVVLFESLEPKRTRIISYGLGYTDSPELRQMMKFFEKANRHLYQRLIDALEED